MATLRDGSQVEDETETDLARLVAGASLDGKIDIRVSTVDTPVQVTYRTLDGERRDAFGSTVPEALTAAALQQDFDSTRAQGVTDTESLPGHPLGSHDSILLRGRDHEPIAARLVWVHRASHAVNGKRRGDRCEEEGINAHAVLVDDLEGLSLSPAVTCSTCGRTGWITEGRFIPEACQTSYDRRRGTDRREGST